MLRDVLRETWAYPSLPQEGQEEELPSRFQHAFLQGMQQAHKEMVQELRQILLKIVRLRFPNALKLAKKQTVNIDDSAVLRELIIQMSLAASIDEAVTYLLEVDEEENDEEY